MLQRMGSKRTVVLMTVVAVMVVFACHNANGPTAPAVPEPSAVVPVAGADLAPPQFDLWATALVDPVPRYLGDKRWVRVEAMCKFSPMGPESPAILWCPPDLYGKCMNLHVDSRFLAGCTRMDHAGRVPRYKVRALKMID